MNPDAPPSQRPAVVAVDLGAESCRVSLLQWTEDEPTITLVHRFANAPSERDGGLRWNLHAIESGVEHGLRACAEQAPEGIAAIGVDGWAVDYVLLDTHGRALGDPFCYRDERTLEAEARLCQCISPERLRQITGVQLLRINTLFQIFAEPPSNRAHHWLNLPEYLLTRLGGRPVAERTNAAHTQMLDLHTGEWSPEILAAAGFDPSLAPALVPPGTDVGALTGVLANRPAFRSTRLLAPACHDTASAVAGIPATGNDWAYISSGTWSLVGTVLETPCNDPATAKENFTNLAAVGGRVCFHKNVNGMWLLKQCLDTWQAAGTLWEITHLIEAAEALERRDGPPQHLLDVDDPPLLLLGDMPQRINAQFTRRGLRSLPSEPAEAPRLAQLIFHSLAARYAEVLRSIEAHTGKSLKRLFVVGGASRNAYLNRLTQAATGLELIRGPAESSTIGNFAVQLAVLSGQCDTAHGADAGHVGQWSQRLGRASHRSAIKAESSYK